MVRSFVPPWFPCHSFLKCCAWFVVSAALVLSAEASGVVHGWGRYIASGLPAGLTNVVSLKAAANYNLALRADGTVVVWGRDDNGQFSNLPPGLSNVTAIAAGYYMPMALTADGRVRVWGAWGHVSQEQIINPPPAATNVVQIAGGMDHCLALRKDGRVVAWGNNLWGQLDVPLTLSNVVSVAAGQAYSLAITASGRVVTWGNSTYYGEIPADATNLVQVAAGVYGHAVGLKSDGSVVAWGYGVQGQTKVPAGLSNAVQVAAGDQHSLALLRDGTVLAWGANDAGQGSPPPNLYKVSLIAAASAHNVAVSEAPLVEDCSPDGGILAGDDLELKASIVGKQPWSISWFKDNALLNGTNSTLVITNLQPEGAGIYSLLVSNEFGYARSRDIYIWVQPWGPRWKVTPENQAVLPGQTAVFNAKAAGKEPLAYQWEHNGKPIEGATNATLVVSGASVEDEGAYTLTVQNELGTLKLDKPVYLAVTLPIALEQPTDIRARPGWTTHIGFHLLSASPLSFRWFKDGQFLPAETNAVLHFAPFMATDSGSYLAEASNQFGVLFSRTCRVSVVSLARGTVEPGVLVDWGNNYYSPASALQTATNIVSVASGVWHTSALKADGSLQVWCDPQNLRLASIPVEATNVADIFAGPDYNCVLRNDGTAVAWGDGVGTLSMSGVSNAISAACGAHSALFLRPDGTVQSVPEMYIPSDATNVVAVGMTSEYGIALRENGRVITWHYDLGAQIPRLENVVAIAPGEAWLSAALRSDGTVVTWNGPRPATWEVAAGISNAVDVAVSRGVTAVLRSGEVVWWGDTPAPPPGLKPVRITSCIYHSAAITPGPFFDQQPLSATNYTGGRARFEAKARSAPPSQYQWYLDGAALSGQTNAYLDLGPLAPHHTGTYTVVARASLNSTRSEPAFLRVLGPPVLVTVPAGQTLKSGDPLKLEATVLSQPEATLQWRFDGLKIPGATNRVLSFERAQDWMSGNYSVTASNEYGVVASPSVQVMVNPSAPEILEHPELPAELPDGSSVELRAVATGSEPISYQWLFNGNPIPGATQSSLRLQQVSSSDDGSYLVVVSNRVGTALSRTATLVTGRSAPRPEIVPGTMLVRERKPLQLLAVARGTTGASFQWRYNGQDLPGETNAIFARPFALASHAGTYSVVAANRFGAMESAPTMVRVLGNPGAGLVRSWGYIPNPPEGLLAEAVAGGYRHGMALLPDGRVQCWGENSYGQATPPAGLSNVVAIAAGNEVSVALKSDSTVISWGADYFGQSSVPPNLTNVVEISAGASHSVALKADGSVVAWGRLPDSLVPTNLPRLVTAAAGRGYSLGLRTNGTIHAWGVPGFGATTLTNPPAQFTNIISVSAGEYVAGALNSSGQARTWGTTYPVPAEASNLVSIAAGGSHLVALRSDFRIFAWGDNVRGQTSIPKGTSNILSAAAGPLATLAVSAEPKVLTPLTSRTVKEGSYVIISARAAGTGPLSYQWYYRTQALEGATGPELSIGVFATNTGPYSLEVRNAYAAARSNVVTLFIGLPPAITNGPADVAVVPGSDARFSVQCTGTGKLYYQWSLNGTNLLGATNSSVLLFNVTSGDQGFVAVRVTNEFGSVVSRQARLDVLSRLASGTQLSCTPAGGGLLLNLSLEQDRRFILETSTNLFDWVPLETMTGADSTLRRVRPMADEPRRFYRVNEVSR